MLTCWHTAHPCGPVTNIMEQTAKLTEPAVNSPDSSPIVTRKLHSNVEGNTSALLPYKDVLQNSISTNEVVVDVTNEESSSASTSLQTKSPSSDDNPLMKCPCNLSDRQSTYVICDKCQQQWHNRCCNLKGLTQAAIRKLEEWQCPRCYKCPIYFPKQSANIQTLSNDMAEVKKQISELHGICFPSEEMISSYKDVSTEVGELKVQIALLTKSSQTKREVTLSPELEAALSKVSDISSETVKNIEGGLSDLSDKVSDLQNSISSSNPVFTSPSPSNLSSSKPCMEPNTHSPHLKKTEAPCEPFVQYKSNVIPENLKSELMEFINASEPNFKPVGEDSREVLYFGKYSYQYTGHKHEPADMPGALTKLLDVVRPKLANPQIPINSCLVSRYITGKNHIPLHRDDEPVIDPESQILTVSMGVKRTMTFTDNLESKKKEQVLEDGSLLVTSRFAQDFWKHAILEDDSQVQRISFTFRNIAPHFINSTIVLGDSNTSRLNFGTGQGTLGAWLPGKRVHVGHIEAIPEATDIGPFRNIVIHTGINSINNARYRKSNTYLMHVLESKCLNILNIYPRTKIHLSMLLPTRSKSLNYQVKEFNNMILDMSYKHRNMYVIDNAIFGNTLSDEHGRWNINEQRPFTADALHLGKKGIRILATNIKSSVMGERSRSKSRFSAGGGKYQGAVQRPGHQDGYQPLG